MFLRRWLAGDKEGRGADEEPGPASEGARGVPAGAGTTLDVRSADASSAATGAETATVRRIVARLEALPPDRARYLAGFAYVMSRAAHADLEISHAETRAMERFAVELGGIDESQAVLVVEMAKLQARHHGATEDFLVTREFGRHATREQKLALLRCCFAVGAADETINPEETGVVNQIARELDVARDDLNAVRADFHEHISAIQAIRRMAAGS